MNIDQKDIAELTHLITKGNKGIAELIALVDTFHRSLKVVGICPPILDKIHEQLYSYVRSPFHRVEVLLNCIKDQKEL